MLGDRFAADARVRALDGVDVPAGWMGLDIGADTAERYGREIQSAGTVFWNGPMGAFEYVPFASGTRAVAEAMALRAGPQRSSAVATRPPRSPASGWRTRVDHLSTGRRRDARADRGPHAARRPRAGGALRLVMLAPAPARPRPPAPWAT